MYICDFIISVMYVLYNEMYGLVEMILVKPPFGEDFSLSDLKSILASVEEVTLLIYGFVTAESCLL